MGNKKNCLYYQFWLFIVYLTCMGMVCASKDYIVYNNLRDLEHNHLSFSGFYKVFVDENYLNDARICHNCLMIGDTHNYYDLLNITTEEKCFGSFDSCKVETLPKNKTFVIGSKAGSARNNNSTVYQIIGTCGTCVCACYPNILQRDKKGLIDSICLDPISVNVSQKYVIIGIQFTRVRNMVMLQLKKGVIQEQSTIFRGSSDWITPPKQCKRIAKLNHNDSYFIMDNAMLPNDYVVTSIAIRKCDERWSHKGKTIRTIRNCEGNFFYLTVYGTTIDNALNGVADGFVEGTFKGPKSLKERTDLTNDNMLPSEHANTNTRPEPGDYFVKFRTTSWSQDKGKHIVPYLNSKQIETKPARPLVGIGMFYYGATDYGGYVSPVIYAHRTQLE